VKFLQECGHKEPEEEQVNEIMEALDRDKNGSISFEELWDWWVGYCMKAGTLHGTGLSPPRIEVQRELQDWDPQLHHDSGKNHTDLHDVVDMSGALDMCKHHPGMLKGRPQDLIKMPMPPPMPIGTPRSPGTFPGPTFRRSPQKQLLGFPAVPSMPSSPGARIISPARAAALQSQGSFAYAGPTLAGMSHTPRGVLRSTVAPKLSPLMRSRPLTHRGPASTASGYKV